MTKLLNRVSLALAVTLFTSPYAIAGPLNTMDDVGKALQACWTAPQGVQKSTVTLRFSFKRDGSLIGPPTTAAIDFPGKDATARKSFIDAAISAVKDCTPLTFSSDLAQGIGGQVFTMQFASPDTCGGDCNREASVRPN
ncbi:hypothetical protein [Phyllobacterium meliloti]|uniref:hypothetical protein n=1 Tax=Phyllobacterium meliloti TaxID=555317 RepID=UPI00351D2758